MPSPLNATATPTRVRTAIILVWAVWITVLSVVLVGSFVRPDRHSVYPIFANAAREWLEGVDIYDTSIVRDSPDQFRYAPVVAIFFVPFATFPDAFGGVLWRLVNVVVFFTGSAAFARVVFPGTGNLDRLTVAILAALLFPLSVGSINNGQSNILIAGCLMLGVAAAVQDNRNLAAVCLAVPVLFKVYPLLVGLLVLSVRPKLGWRVGILLAFGCLLPFAFQESEFVVRAYQSWFNQVSGDNRLARSWENSYRDFHLLMRIVGLNLEIGVYRVLQLGSAGAVAAVVLRGRWLGWPKAWQLRTAFDMGSCWVILFGPATESATYALLAPTFAFASFEAFRPGCNARSRRLLTATIVLFAAVLLVHATPWGKATSVYLLPTGALLLFAERLWSYCRVAAWQPIVSRVC
jgi:hypothetical protein